MRWDQRLDGKHRVVRSYDGRANGPDSAVVAPGIHDASPRFSGRVSRFLMTSLLKEARPNAEPVRGHMRELPSKAALFMTRLRPFS